MKTTVEIMQRRGRGSCYRILDSCKFIIFSFLYLLPSLNIWLFFFIPGGDAVQLAVFGKDGDD